MAHAATLAALAESLVTAVTGRTADDAAFRTLRDNAVKGLRDQSYARTNQYTVKHQLDGLIEKFAVLNREPLSVALESRLAQVPASSGWMPDILALLLALSDQPATKTALADVERANQDQLPAPRLTWEDIVAEDPIDDPAIWETVERGYHSSGDDEVEDESEATISTKATSVDDLSSADIARLHLQAPHENALDAVKDARSLWDAKSAESRSLCLSEVAVTRDLLSMLHGLPTDIFHKDVATGRVTIAGRVHISTASRVGLLDILQSAADAGTSLNALRLWAAESQDLLYVQSFQAAVQQLLAVFGRNLDDIEQGFMNSRQCTTLTILDVQTQAYSAARPLLRVTALVQGCPSPELLPFGLMDAFFEAVAVAQMAGDAVLHDVLVAVFLEGFTTYLRPVRSWIATGMIDTHEEATFFVEEAEKDCIRGELWHARFQMRETEFIPRCVRPVAATIFALGKGQAFLQSLGPLDVPEIPNNVSLRLPIMTQDREQQSLAPFAQLLGDAINTWLADITADKTHSLPLSLLQDHGLQHVMTALPGLYFSADGSQFQAFAESLVEHMHPNSAKSWGDHFLLTKLAHDTLGSLQAVEPENIYVYTTGTKDQAAPSSMVRRLGHVHIRYTLPWPLQNVTRSSTPKPHAQVLSLLLQLHYSATLLSRSIFDLRSCRRIARESLGLRQRIQCFVAVFQAHVTLTANSAHKKLRQKMETAHDVDAMVMVWAEYEKQLQHNLLLSNELSPLRLAVVRIMVLSEVVCMTLQPERAQNLRGQVDKEVRFLSTGLRNISQVGGQSLEILAERLEWDLG